MTVSRRGLVLGGLAAGAAPLLVGSGPAEAAQTGPQGSPGDEILKLFAGLPGTVAIKIDAPAAGGNPGLQVSDNASQQLFVGSAFKTFVLCEAFRQADSPNVLTTITTQQLSLDQSVWSLDSATFNPPNMIGMVTERTAMEAMIMHSDNTGTDMMLKFTGPGAVRSFISSAGLTKTMIPDSTRVFFAYLLGLPNYKTATYLDVIAASNGPFVHPPLNPVQTMASPADDLVYYYSRALQGKFFQHQETLNQFLEILSIGDAIWLIPVPLGVSAFIKGGSIDVPGFHAVCTPGGLFFNNRWVFFCFTLNWPAPGETDPKTVAAFAAAVHQALQIVITVLSLQECLRATPQRAAPVMTAAGSPRACRTLNRDPGHCQPRHSPRIRVFGRPGSRLKTLTGRPGGG